MQHYSADFTRRLLLEAGLKPGMRMLDVGCGYGDVTRLIALLVGESGSVLGIDTQAATLEVSRQRGGHFQEADINRLPAELDHYDAIVGRRVLMYQPDPLQTLRGLAQRLKPGGLLIFQEADLTMVPARLQALPLHEKAHGWVREMIRLEGCDLNMGFHLDGLLRRAGLRVGGVRAEAIVQTPDQPSTLGFIVQAVLPRILDQGVTTAAEVEIDTLQSRLDAERIESGATFIGDMMFGAWATR